MKNTYGETLYMTSLHILRSSVLSQRYQQLHCNNNFIRYRLISQCADDAVIKVSHAALSL